MSEQVPERAEAGDPWGAPAQLSRRALDIAADAIITVDASGTITSWNQKAVEIFGHEAADAIGQTLALIVPPAHRPRHVAGFHAALSSRRLAHGGRPALIEGMTADGRVVPLEMTLALLPEEDGAVGVVAVIRRGATDPDSFI